jgi:hypothetical protein
MTFHIGTPHTRGAGYLINGVNLSRPDEADIRTCPHCQRIIRMQQWRDDGAWCNKCNAPICGNNNPACVLENKLYGCVPFLKKLEAFTGAQLKRQQFMKVAGLDAPPPAFIPKLIITP